MIDVLLGAFLEAARDDWVTQPSRSAYAGIIQQAARIPPRWQAWAKCISDRESGGSYTARNPSSSAQGRWQFLDNSWRVHGGLHHMVVKRLRAHGLDDQAAVQLRQHLRDTPIAEWPGPYQDTGFVAVLLSGGQHHWNGPGCTGLAPR